MKVIISICAIFILIGCTPEDQKDCGCGTVVKVEGVATQPKYTVKNDCNGSLHTFESRYEFLTVGMRTCN